jgi:hypothetical protein
MRGGTIQVLEGWQLQPRVLWMEGLAVTSGYQHVESFSTLTRLLPSHLYTRPHTLLSNELSISKRSFIE